MVKDEKSPSRITRKSKYEDECIRRCPIHCQMDALDELMLTQKETDLVLGAKTQTLAQVEKIIDKNVPEIIRTNKLMGNNWTADKLKELIEEIKNLKEVGKKC